MLIYRHILFQVLLVAFALGSSKSADYYVSAGGSAGGAGSISDPITLAKAISGTSPAQPGDTVYMRGGTYVGTFTSVLAGSSGSPITLRQYPGERAIVSCDVVGNTALTINGSWANYWGFEVMNSVTDRTVTRGNGVDVFGPNTKLIHLIVHDAGVGIGLWEPATDAEVYGCLLFYNGWQEASPGTGHGHGIYTQNASGTKIVQANVMFHQFRNGIQFYGQAGEVIGYHALENVSFSNGSLRTDEVPAVNFLIYGFNPVSDILFHNNLSFHASGVGGVGFELGLSAINISGTDYSNDNLICRSNYMSGGNFLCNYWTNAVVEKNTIISGSASYAIQSTPGPGSVGYSWNDNSYFASHGTPFLYNSSGKSFADWKTASGFDSSSTVSGSMPSTPTVFTIPSAYEYGRVTVVVYNPGMSDNVSVDLSSYLQNGGVYRLRSVQDWYGATLNTWQHSGAAVSVPMTNLPAQLPVGDSLPTATWPAFNVFVVDMLAIAKPTKPRRNGGMRGVGL